ncbi:MAG: thiamine phosphate synthase, partial [Nitrospinaceae bacterium]|nr:thiamine phosphate synthase [Nitrospinaceae bacterium]NIS87204.1 thiamine phosphate synthase [Nitrospinaceae bacterium]NIU98433.1 thiamine-phosphate phosphorylase [Nitrospinaceae bacterium]
QLREKDLSAAALVPWAERVRALTARYGAALYINGHPGVADRVKADGVHLPETGPRPDEVRARHPGLRIGVSTHSL